MIQKSSMWKLELLVVWDNVDNTVHTVTSGAPPADITGGL